MTRTLTAPVPTPAAPDIAELFSMVFAGAAPPRTLEALLDWLERRT